MVWHARVQGQQLLDKRRAERWPLQGNFTDGSGDYPFSLSAGSGKFEFTAGSFTAALERQGPVRLKGVYKSARVKLDFKNKDGGINGTIDFRGQQYEFSAKDVVGTLEGMFKTGDQSFPFTLRIDSDRLFFKTGTFEETISLAEQTERVAKIKQEIKRICDSENERFKKDYNLAGRPGLYPFPGTYLLSAFKSSPEGKLTLEFWEYKQDAAKTVVSQRIQVDPSWIKWETLTNSSGDPKGRCFDVQLTQEVPIIVERWGRGADTPEPVETDTVDMFRFYISADEFKALRQLIVEAADKLVALRRQLAEAEGELPTSQAAQPPQ